MNNTDNSNKMDVIKKIIASETEPGLERFRNSDIETGIYVKIRGKSSRYSVPLRKLLIPASILTLIIISSLVYQISDKKQDGMENPILLVLKNVASGQIGTLAEKTPEIPETIFESSIKNVLYSVRRSNIAFEEVIANIISAIEYAKQIPENNVISWEDIKKREHELLKKEIFEMHTQKDYSALFSRIIKNIKEG